MVLDQRSTPALALATLYTALKRNRASSWWSRALYDTPTFRSREAIPSMLLPSSPTTLSLGAKSPLATCCKAKLSSLEPIHRLPKKLLPKSSFHPPE